jgi:hypothetical protein
MPLQLNRDNWGNLTFQYEPKGVMMEISMDGSDPATWDPALDAVLAAPENHTVLYEDDLIRVISVRVAPRATEKPHHHRFPAVFVIDRMVKLRDFNGVTRQEISLPIPKDAVVPITLKFAPQPLHFVENFDTKPFHATRIEFKQGFPAESDSASAMAQVSDPRLRFSLAPRAVR